MNLIAQKLALVFADTSPIWKKLPPEQRATGSFSHRCKTFNSLLPENMRVADSTLKRWRSKPTSLTEEARSLPEFCTAIAYLVPSAKPEPRHFYDVTHTFEDFSAMLGVEVCQARFAVARDFMSDGLFFPAHKNMHSQHELETVVGYGMYVAERFIDEAQAARGDPCQSRCLLVVDRALCRPDGGHSAYVRFFAPAAPGDGVRSPLEYEGMMLKVDSISYLMLHCVSIRAHDMVFMVLGSKGQPPEYFEGQYVSVHIEGRQEAKPEARFIKMQSVASLERKRRLPISDARIFDKLAELFPDSITPHTSARPPARRRPKAKGR